MEKKEKIDHKKILESALENTIKKAQEDGIIDEPEIKKYIEKIRKSTREQIDVLDIIEDHNSRIFKLNQLGFKEESIILTVTIFEVLMKRDFWESKNFWFFTPTDEHSKTSLEYRMAIRKKIQKYLKSIKLFPEYLSNLYLYSNTTVEGEIDCLFETLFKNERKLNFQNLKTVQKIYLTFFDIDLSTCLDHNPEKSRNKWELLEKLINERHNIIHKGKKTSFTQDQIIEILKSIDTIFRCIGKKKAIYVISTWNEISSDFEKKYGKIIPP